MEEYAVSQPKNALLIFVDIVDSSIYSTFLGPTEFAERVLEFQKLFEELGALYFPKINNYIPINKYYNISSRGDEGLIFILDPEVEKNELVYKAIKFLFELKARFRINQLVSKKNDSPPKEIEIAAGVHYGEVVPITCNYFMGDRYRSKIEKLIGYSINYAKRIESSSRIGTDSKIFISKQVHSILKYYPLIFNKFTTHLKGIKKNEDVYEIKSAFLEDIPIKEKNNNTVCYENIFNYFINEDNISIFANEPWCNSIIISILSNRHDNVKLKSLKKEYYHKINNVAWKEPNENDPILLFQRARDCTYEKKYTRAISYYKKIINMYPDFIHARIKLAEICYKSLKQNQKHSIEEIFVRDTIEEYLEKYSNILTAKEKEIFNLIHKEINKKA